MPAMLISIMSKLVVALATEAFAKHLLLRLGKEIAKSTESTVDDDIVRYVADAWGLGEDNHNK